MEASRSKPQTPHFQVRERSEDSAIPAASIPVTNFFDKLHYARRKKSEERLAFLGTRVGGIADVAGSIAAIWV